MNLEIESKGISDKFTLTLHVLKVTFMGFEAHPQRAFISYAVVQKRVDSIEF